MSQSAGTPAAEVDIDVDEVRRLLAAQHPDLSKEPLRPLDSGWDNASFRLGTTMIVRLPRRQAAADLLLNEQRWLPILQRIVSLPIPAPIRIGTPDEGYPWHWSIVPWFEGDTADRCPLHVDQSAALAQFFCSVHQGAPAEAPRNPVRGVALASRAEALRARFDRLHARHALVSPRIQEIWERAIQAPIDITPTWIHGDLHARNVVVEAGRIHAVIDWGDVAQGDRATDLAAIWMLQPQRAAREETMRFCGAISPTTWQRARGWAVLFGVTLLDSGLIDNPAHERMGELTLQRVLDGP
jgi:aminoglycoside phosphotransferase (APT) family kinase protein